MTLTHDTSVKGLLENALNANRLVTENYVISTIYDIMEELVNVFTGITKLLHIGFGLGRFENYQS